MKVVKSTCIAFRAFLDQPLFVLHIRFSQKSALMTKHMNKLRKVECVPTPISISSHS